MALYQLWESQTLYYAEWNQFNYGGIERNLDYFVGQFAPNESLYSDTFAINPGLIFNIWVQRDQGVGTHSYTYVFCSFATRQSPGFRYVVYKIDSKTGQVLWRDDESYTINIFLTGLIQGYLTDLDDRIWADHVYGYTYRCSRIAEGTAVPPENNRAKGEGMPNLGTYDHIIHYNEWLQEDGSAIPGVDGVRKVLAMLPSQNVMVGRCRNLVSWVDSYALDHARYVNDGRRYVTIFDYTTKRLKYIVRVPGDPLKAIVVDSQIMYLFCAGGVIATLNYKLGRVTGILYGGPKLEAPGSRWVPVGFDPVYRRIAVGTITPDDAVTGESTTRLRGYSPIELPVGLTGPIPQFIPRQGRTVPVFARVYGHGGKGLPGHRVKAEITSGGTNTITPQFAVSNSSGYVVYNWTCNDAGIDIDDITLTLEYEEADPDFTPSTDTPLPILPPTCVKQESDFHPGYYGWTYHSNSTPATKWDSYLTGYSGTHPLVGVVQEYYWTDFENSTPGSFDFSKITADRNYLDALGLKLIIFIRFARHYDGSNSPVPDDFNSPLFPAPLIHTEDFHIELKLNNVGGLSLINDLAGTFQCNLAIESLHDRAGSWTGESFYGDNMQAPALWQPDVRTRYKAMIQAMMAAFSADNAIAGYFPLGSDEVDREDLRNTGHWSSGIARAEDDWKQLRRELLVELDALTDVPVFDMVTLEGGNFTSSTHKWYSDNCIPYVVWGWSVIEGDSDFDWFISNASAREKVLSNGFYIPRGEPSHTPAQTHSYDRQLQCDSSPATLLDIIHGGLEMADDSPVCARKFVTKDWNPWFGFVDLTTDIWTDTDGLEEVGLNHTLPIVAEYRGEL